MTLKSIKVEEKLKKRLDGFREHHRETYQDIIGRLADVYDREVVSVDGKPIGKPLALPKK